MKRHLFWLFFAAMVFVFAGCGDATDSDLSAKADASDPLTLQGESESEIVFHVAFGEVLLNEVERDGQLFLAASVDGFNHQGEIGEPALPALRRWVSVPHGAELTVEAEPVMVETIRLAHPLLPNQPPIEKIPGALESAPFVIDAETYALDSYLVGRDAEILEEAQVRNHRLALLEVTPIDYNPVKGELRIARDLTVTVRMTGADLMQSLDLTDRFGSFEFDALVHRHLANKGDKWAPFTAPVAGADYLIIYADALAGTALTNFVNLKAADGWTVTTKKVSEIGATPASIVQYIKGRYTALPALTFVLLVGDTNTIPHVVGNAADRPATDLYYSTMTIGDYQPDLLVGRFPVRTTAQLANLVAKITAYEAETDDWRKTGVFMASNDNWSISEGTHNFVISGYLTPHGYTSTKLYCHTYNATTQQVTNAFNAGANFGIYSGHGDVTYWADGPVFYQSNVTALTNTKYPFVASFACLTGKYTTDECFAETWVRDDRGASAMLASSVTSYWTEDDWYEKGLFMGMFDFPVAGYPNQVWTASAVLSGKFTVGYMSNWGGSSRRYYEMYNLFGDPSMVLYTF
jgi:hypothetical protein